MRGADSAGSGRERFAGHGVLRFEEQYHIGSSGENRPDIESYVCEGEKLSGLYTCSRGNCLSGRG